MCRSFLPPLLAVCSAALVACQDETALTRPTASPSEIASPTVAAVANSWRAGAPMPAGRYAHAAESITSPSGDPLVYAFGGIDADPNHEATEEHSVQVYNARTDTWSTRTPSPSLATAKSNGASRIGNKIYLSGGGVDVQSAPDLWLKSLHRYDPSLDRWTRLADMPHPSGLGVSGVIDGKLFVLTGYDNRLPRDGELVQSMSVPRSPPAGSFATTPARTPG